MTQQNNQLVSLSQLHNLTISSTERQSFDAAMKELKSIGSQTDNIFDVKAIACALHCMADMYLNTRSTLATGADQQRLARRVYILEQFNLLARYFDTAADTAEGVAESALTGGMSMKAGGVASVKSVLGLAVNAVRTAFEYKVNQAGHKLETKERVEGMVTAVNELIASVQQLLTQLDKKKNTVSSQISSTQQQFCTVNRVIDTEISGMRDTNLVINLPEYNQAVGTELSRTQLISDETKFEHYLQWYRAQLRAEAHGLYESSLAKQQAVLDLVNGVLNSDEVKRFKDELALDRAAIKAIDVKSFNDIAEDYIRPATRAGFSECVVMGMIAVIFSYKRNSGGSIKKSERKKLLAALKSTLGEIADRFAKRKLNSQLNALYLLASLAQPLREAGCGETTLEVVPIIKELALLLGIPELGDLLFHYNTTCIRYSIADVRRSKYLDDILLKDMSHRYSRKKTTIFDKAYGLGNALSRHIDAGASVAALQRMLSKQPLDEKTAYEFLITKKAEVLVAYLYQILSQHATSGRMSLLSSGRANLCQMAVQLTRLFMNGARGESYLVRLDELCDEKIMRALLSKSQLRSAINNFARRDTLGSHFKRYIASQVSQRRELLTATGKMPEKSKERKPDPSKSDKSKGKSQASKGNSIIDVSGYNNNCGLYALSLAVQRAALAVPGFDIEASGMPWSVFAGADHFQQTTELTKTLGNKLRDDLAQALGHDAEFQLNSQAKFIASCVRGVVGQPIELDAQALVAANAGYFKKLVSSLGDKHKRVDYRKIIVSRKLEIYRDWKIEQTAIRDAKIIFLICLHDSKLNVVGKRNQLFRLLLSQYQQQRGFKAKLKYFLATKAAWEQIAVGDGNAEERQALKECIDNCLDIAASRWGSEAWLHSWLGICKSLTVNHEGRINCEVTPARIVENILVEQIKSKLKDKQENNTKWSEIYENYLNYVAQSDVMLTAGEIDCLAKQWGVNVAFVSGDAAARPIRVSSPSATAQLSVILFNRNNTHWQVLHDPQQAAPQVVRRTAAHSGHHRSRSVSDAASPTAASSSAVGSSAAFFTTSVSTAQLSTQAATADSLTEPVPVPTATPKSAESLGVVPY